LKARLGEHREAKSASDQNKVRKDQIGGGYRGEKVRTIRVQDGIVKCELTGKSWTYAQYVKGKIT
jgi:protein subunit release factor A